MMITKYKCFTRNWWKDNPDWPNGLEPFAAGPKRTRAIFETGEEARNFCQNWNKAHNPGRLSNKCEFMEIRKRGEYNRFLGRYI